MRAVVGLHEHTVDRGGFDCSGYVCSLKLCFVRLFGYVGWLVSVRSYMHGHSRTAREEYEQLVESYE